MRQHLISSYVFWNISMPTYFQNMFSKYDSINKPNSAGSFFSRTTRQYWYLQLVVRGRLSLHGCLQANFMWCHAPICLTVFLCLLPWQVMKAFKQSIAFPEMRGMTVTAGCHESCSWCSLCNQSRPHVADAKCVFLGWVSLGVICTDFWDCCQIHSRSLWDYFAHWRC